MNYTDLPLHELIDLLPTKTKRMLGLMSNGQFQQSKEYLECRKDIEEIQKIILQKKKFQEHLIKIQGS